MAGFTYISRICEHQTKLWCIVLFEHRFASQNRQQPHLIMTTRTERFQRKPNDGSSAEPAEPEEIVKFSPEEEAELLNESNAQKASANALFAKSSFQDAIETYDKALSSCPNYLDYEIAVLKSNIAACHLKLEDWKEAVKAASAALDGLDRLQKKEKGEGVEKKVEEEEEADEEIVSEGATKAEDTSERGKRETDIERIRAKALMRRARARSEQDGWASLQGAEEGIVSISPIHAAPNHPSRRLIHPPNPDYKLLSSMNNLSTSDRQLVKTQLRLLPARTKAAQEREMGEMMGTLKQVSLADMCKSCLIFIEGLRLGNGILKPFGLSTDNFQMVKDEKTGGYSMNFNQGGS
ncbi:tetratricopeptide repeat 1 protein [Rutstroemia sp. NJR-2017a BVV2]|nr:tetratricopeptide repeat 1 protein [Rutstroemia sp. NJR-2017a BVV2]